MQVKTIAIDFTNSSGNDTLKLVDQSNGRTYIIYAADGMQQTIRLNTNHLFSIDWSFYNVDVSSCSMSLIKESPNTASETIASVYLNPIGSKSQRVDSVILSDSLYFNVQCR